MEILYCLYMMFIHEDCKVWPYDKLQIGLWENLQFWALLLKKLQKLSVYALFWKFCKVNSIELSYRKHNKKDKVIMKKKKHVNSVHFMYIFFGGSKIFINYSR